METSTIVITVLHLALFVYTRRKYVGKYKRAQQQLSNVEMENTSLKMQNKMLEDHINAYE